MTITREGNYSVVPRRKEKVEHYVALHGHRKGLGTRAKQDGEKHQHQPEHRKNMRKTSAINCVRCGIGAQAYFQVLESTLKSFIKPRFSHHQQSSEAPILALEMFHAAHEIPSVGYLPIEVSSREIEAGVLFKA